MNRVQVYYESVGNSLKGKDAERAYRAAQNALSPAMPGYMDALKRLQGKIILAVEAQV